MKAFRSFLLLMIVSGILFAGCAAADESQTVNTTVPTQQPDSTATTSTSLSVTGSTQQEGVTQQTEVKFYTAAEVAVHKTPDDCWFIIHGKVYNVSGNGEKHPGGEAIYQGCGIDATQLFETRPMGSGTPHSEKARGFMERSYIGDLKN